MGFLLCVGDNLVSGRLKGVIQEALRSLCTVHAGRQRVADWKQGAEGHNPTMWPVHRNDNAAAMKFCDNRPGSRPFSPSRT
jgi:hypothetical protein